MEVYVVIFRSDSDEIPVLKRTWYFSSIAAIYDKFSPEDIGCTLKTLWNLGLAKGSPYSNKKVLIVKQPVYEKKQSKKTH